MGKLVGMRLFVVFAVVFVLFVLFQALVNHVPLTASRYIRTADEPVSRRLVKSIIYDDEEDSDEYSEDWPDIETLEKRVKEYVESKSNSSSGYLFPWSYKIPDNRDKFCDKTYGYNASSWKYPPAAIIVGGGNASLLQILSSVMFISRNTPKHLVQNIFVVTDERLSMDDFNILENLLVPVPFFRTFHLANYSVDLPSRAFATTFTSAKFFVFMDAKVIVGPGWLEPLLAEVGKGHRTVAVPVVVPYTAMSDHDLSWYTLRRRELDWDLNLRWGLGTTTMSSDSRVLTKQPAIYEDLFVVSADHFKDIGGFDRVRNASGAEAALWSIKTWLCHGQIIRASCSKIVEFQEPKGKNIAYSPKFVGERVRKYKEYIAQTFFGSASIYLKCLVSSTRYYYFTRATKIYSVSLKCNAFSTFIRLAQRELKSPPRNSEHFGRLKLVHTDMYVSVDARNRLIMVSNQTSMTNEFSFYDNSLTYRGLCLDTTNNADLKFVRCANVPAFRALVFINGMLKIKNDKRFCISRVARNHEQLGRIQVVNCPNPTKHNIFQFSLSFKKNCLRKR